MSLLSFLILIVPIIGASLAQLCFKRGVLGLGDIELSFSGIVSLIPKIFQNMWLLSGVILFGMSFLVYLFVLSKFQLNIVYPIFVSTGIILITVASWFLFKETLSWFQIIGIVSIIFGIFLLAANN